jgi:hypothetical protein
MVQKNKQITYFKIFSAPLLFATGVLSFLVLIPGVVAASMTSSSVISLANHARAEAGLPALTENAKLDAAAEAKAKDMIKNDYFAHTSPAGRDPWYWIHQADYSYKAAGENLAINYEDSNEQQSAWMKSATHRANILNAKYAETGVAVVEGKIDGETSIVTVQIFGMPAVAIVDRAVPVVPVVPQEARKPAIKGVETEQSAQSLVGQSALSQSVETLPHQASAIVSATAHAKEVWFEKIWYIAAAVFIVTVCMAPIMLVAKSISALYSQFREEQLLHAAYQAAVMALAFSGHTQPLDIQHSG